MKTKQTSTPFASSDGVVKFSSLHVPADLETALTAEFGPSTVPDLVHRIDNLDHVRTILYDLHLIGAIAAGIGYGNLSFRTGRHSFVISGSGTGQPRILGRRGYCLVREVVAERNEVHSEGPVKASSESMTHAAVYTAFSKGKLLPYQAGCVIHVHSSELFAKYRRIGPATSTSALYGTPALAREVLHLVMELHTTTGFLVLAGHQDGLVFFAPSPMQALDVIRQSMLSLGKSRF